MASHYRFLINPRSGAGKGRRIGEVLSRILANHPILGQDASEVTMLDGLTAEQLRRLVSESKTIFAIGGDGTISGLLAFLMQSKSPPALGLLPIGTSNDLARALGAAVDADFTDERVLRQTLDRLLAKRPYLLDIFCVNERWFFCNYFSVGLDAAIVCDFDRIRSSKMTRLLPHGRFTNNMLYFFMGLKNARFHLAAPIEISFELSGKKDNLKIDHPIRALIAGNLPVYAGGCRICPEAKTDDGLFEIFIVRSALQYLLLIGTRFIPFLRLPRGITKLQAGRAEIHFASPAPFQIDGEKGSESGVGHLQISCCGSVSVIV
jgi:diacylglycerol kinase family enzyme